MIEPSSLTVVSQRALACFAAPVIRDTGCFKMKCRCGYRFCFKCGSENAQCECTRECRCCLGSRCFSSDPTAPESALSQRHQDRCALFFLCIFVALQPLFMDSLTTLLVSAGAGSGQQTHIMAAVAGSCCSTLAGSQARSFPAPPILCRARGLFELAGCKVADVAAKTTACSLHCSM